MSRACFAGQESVRSEARIACLDELGGGTGATKDRNREAGRYSAVGKHAVTCLWCWSNGKGVPSVPRGGAVRGYVASEPSADRGRFLGWAGRLRDRL